MIDYVSLFIEILQLAVLIYIARKEISYLTPSKPMGMPSFKPYAKPDPSGKRKPIAHDDAELYERELQSNNRA